MPTHPLAIPPCPFCHYSGNTKQNLLFIDHLFASQCCVSCGNCGASGPISSTRREAIKQWSHPGTVQPK